MITRSHLYLLVLDLSAFTDGGGAWSPLLLLAEAALSQPAAASLASLFDHYEVNISLGYQCTCQNMLTNPVHVRVRSRMYVFATLFVKKGQSCDKSILSMPVWLEICFICAVSLYEHTLGQVPHSCAPLTPAVHRFEHDSPAARLLDLKRLRLSLLL